MPDANGCREFARRGERHLAETSVQLLMATVRSLLQIRVFAGVVGLMLSSAAVHGQMLGDGSHAAPVERVAPGSVMSAPPPGPPPVNTAGNGYAPPFESVMASNFSQTAFTFDRSMLQAADGFFANGDAETKRVVAGLNSITVHNYRARDFARYDASALAAIDAQYRASGWKHLVNANAKNSASITDLWLHFSGPNISGLTVLTRGDRNMNVISVDCILRPLDLMHLSGHFGIPKVDEGAVMVPAR
jgi:hypothetical protein